MGFPEDASPEELEALVEEVRAIDVNKPTERISVDRLEEVFTKRITALWIDLETKVRDCGKDAGTRDFDLNWLSFRYGHFKTYGDFQDAGVIEFVKVTEYANTISWSGDSTTTGGTIAYQYMTWDSASSNTYEFYASNSSVTTGDYWYSGQSFTQSLRLDTKPWLYQTPVVREYFWFTGKTLEDAWYEFDAVARLDGVLDEELQ